MIRPESPASFRNLLGKREGGRFERGLNHFPRYNKEVVTKGFTPLEVSIDLLEEESKKREWTLEEKEDRDVPKEFGRLVQIKRNDGSLVITVFDIPNIGPCVLDIELEDFIREFFPETLSR